MFRNVSAALSFLTIFRIPFLRHTWSPGELAASFSCFPLAGFVLGLIYYGAAFVFLSFIPALLLSALISTMTVLLTRGLHFDGLADFADGIWGAYSPERRLEIMKDSRTGSFGVLAIVIVFTVKTASVYSLISEHYLAPLLVAPVLSRFAMVSAAYGSTYARKEGLAGPFLENMRREHLAAAAGLAIICSAPGGSATILYLTVTLACAFFIKVFSRKCLGGITGDVLGALNEISETTILVLGACIAAG